jgi:hypothetical protein
MLKRRHCIIYVLSFLHRPRAMLFFCKTFTNAYGLWRCTCEIFRLNFLTLRNIIFWHREHMQSRIEFPPIATRSCWWETSTNGDGTWLDVQTAMYLSKQRLNWSELWRSDGKPKCCWHDRLVAQVNNLALIVYVDKDLQHPNYSELSLKIHFW